MLQTFNIRVLSHDCTLLNPSNPLQFSNDPTHSSTQLAKHVVRQ
jgi:hypothetical protein